MYSADLKQADLWTIPLHGSEDNGKPRLQKRYRRWQNCKPYITRCRTSVNHLQTLYALDYDIERNTVPLSVTFSQLCQLFGYFARCLCHRNNCQRSYGVFTKNKYFFISVLEGFNNIFCRRCRRQSMVIFPRLKTLRVNFLFH